MLFRGDLYLYRRGRKKQVSRIQKAEKNAERKCRDEERQERTDRPDQIDTTSAIVSPYNLLCVVSPIIIIIATE